jgi:hypothetical protein
MNETDKIIFKSFKTKPLSKDRALFFRSSIPHKGFQAKRNKKLIFS